MDLSFMTEPLARIDNARVPFSQAALPVWDLGVVGGLAVTEMARTYAHRPFRLERHIDRLVGSCRQLGIPMRYSSSQLREFAMDLVQHNAAMIQPDTDLGIVMFVTAGSNATYLDGKVSEFGTTVVHTFPLPLASWRTAALQGVRLVVPATRQIPEDSLPIRCKIRNRLHWWLADQEASRIQTGARALLLDHQEDVTETSTAAFHVIIDGVVCTPDGGVLDSMSSRVVQELCDSSQIPFRRCRVPSSHLAQCSEAFLSSSASCLLPVSSINGRTTGTTIPGPVCKQLQSAWSELVGVDIVDQICSAAA
jgi:branched-chain amino acid aminotransferase